MLSDHLTRSAKPKRARPWRRVAIALAGVLAATLGTLIVTATPALADNATVRLRSTGTDEVGHPHGCLTQAGINPGDPVYFIACDYTDPGYVPQIWNAVHIGDTNYHNFISASSGLCLTGDYSEWWNEGRWELLYLDTCTGRVEQQFSLIRSKAGGAGYLRNANPEVPTGGDDHKCVTVPWGLEECGAAVERQAIVPEFFNGTVPAPAPVRENGEASIRGPYESYPDGVFGDCVTAQGHWNNVQLKTAGCQGWISQRFTFDGGGAMRLFANTPDLDAKCVSPRALLQDCNGSYRQIWLRFGYRLVNQATGDCLTPPRNSGYLFGHKCAVEARVAPPVASQRWDIRPW